MKFFYMLFFTLILSSIQANAGSINCTYQNENAQAIIVEEDVKLRCSDDYFVTLYGIGADFGYSAHYSEFTIRCSGEDLAGTYTGLKINGSFMFGGALAGFIGMNGVCSLSESTAKAFRGGLSVSRMDITK